MISVVTLMWSEPPTHAYAYNCSKHLVVRPRTVLIVDFASAIVGHSDSFTACRTLNPHLIAGFLYIRNGVKRSAL